MFEAPRRMASIGLVMLVILFMGGFITIGGEWCQMGRSESWNGLPPEFQNAVLALRASSSSTCRHPGGPS